MYHMECYSSELLDGVSVYDDKGRKVTESRYAAVKGISQVTFSRILIAAPSMCELGWLSFVSMMAKW